MHLFLFTKTLEVNQYKVPDLKVKITNYFFLLFDGNSSIFSKILKTPRYNNMVSVKTCLCYKFFKKALFKTRSINVSFNVTLILFTLDFTHGIQIFSKSNSCHPSSLFSYHCALSLWWIQPKDFCPLVFKLLSSLLPLSAGETCDLLLTNIM